jgi:polyphenol oxidase
MTQLSHIEYGFTIEPKNITRPLYRQVHGKELIEVTEPSLPQLYETPPEADGAYTRVAGLKLSVFSADCLPILLFTEDPTGPIAAIHSGWRGTALGIAKQIETLWSDYKNQIHAILGPCLQSCCFEVKEDLIRAFLDKGSDISHYLKHRDNRIFFSMSDFVLREQLSFIPQSQIHLDNLKCTYCASPTLPSYRRNKVTDPRIRGWIVKTT